MLWDQLKAHFGFVLTIIAIIAGLVLLSMLFERYSKNKRKVSSTRRICIISVSAALASVLMLIEFPLTFLAPEFYKLDFSDVPALLCGYYLGPTAAVLCEAVKIMLKLLLKPTSTAFIGEFANFVVGCSLVLPAVMIYKLKAKRSYAIWGMVLGTVSLAVIGSSFNAFFLLPKFAEFYGIPLDAIVAMGTAVNGSIHSVSTFVLFSVVPLNIIKGCAVSILTLLLYKRVARPLYSI